MGGMERELVGADLLRLLDLSGWDARVLALGGEEAEESQPRVRVSPGNRSYPGGGTEAGWLHVPKWAGP